MEDRRVERVGKRVEVKGLVREGEGGRKRFSERGRGWKIAV